jgi:hypothetical protein
VHACMPCEDQLLGACMFIRRRHVTCCKTSDIAQQGQHAANMQINALLQDPQVISQQAHPALQPVPLPLLPCSCPASDHLLGASCETGESFGRAPLR